MAPTVQRPALCSRDDLLDVGKVLRTAQTYLPGLADLKYSAQFHTRRLRRRPFEADFELLAHFAPDPAEDLLDVGANRAQSVQATRLFNTTNPITCFEPGGHVFRRLRRYTRHVDRVELRNVGLGAEAGTMTLFTPVYRGYVFDGLASVVRSEAADWLVGRVIGYDPARLEVREERIRIETLDAQGLRPALLKIDVQGSELDVLRGGRETIEACRPLVLVEAPDEDAETAFLADLGYTAHSYVDGRLRPGVGGAVNAFFVPPERHDQLAPWLLAG